MDYYVMTYAHHIVVHMRCRSFRLIWHIQVLLICRLISSKTLSCGKWDVKLHVPTHFVKTVGKFRYRTFFTWNYLPLPVSSSLSLLIFQPFIRSLTNRCYVTYNSCGS